MAPFRNPVDIANRAMQHIGAKRISDRLGFNEDSKNASEARFAYDKLRRAELQANIWRMSTRKTVLRAIDDNTMLLDPALWSSSATYFPGAIVSDETNLLWISTTPDNLNNAPGNSYAWEIYTGSMTVSKWDPDTAYFAGELVWTAPGDGTYRVFVSLQSANSDNPNVPTQWSATAIYSKDSVVEFYPAWAIGTTYAAGAGVTSSGTTYISLAAGNVGNAPAAAPTKWVVLQASVLEWDATISYAAGNIVDVNGTQYVALMASTGLIPASNPAQWAAVSGGANYASLVDINIGNEPDLSPPQFSLTTSYSSGQDVIASDRLIYQSLVNGNIGNDPVSDNGTHWNPTGGIGAWAVGPASSMKWLDINPVALAPLLPMYPIGAGPASQDGTRNVFRLPSNYLRPAPQDPAAGAVSFLGAPSGLVVTDWEYEGDYLVSRESNPIVFRFVADIYDVTKMTDVFCEALAARIGMETCEPITQSSAKVDKCSQMYKHWIDVAGRQNGIELGPVEPPIDDYIACRW